MCEPAWMTMASFDERGWREQNEWSGPPPTPIEVWQAINAPGVSEAFSDRLGAHLASCEALQAGCVQQLRHESDDGADLLALARAALGRNIRPATLDRLLESEMERSTWKVAFSNLVSGRFTELIFQRTYEVPLSEVGIVLIEEVADRSFLDFRLAAGNPG
ncbi:MAG: hypothetical protein ACR2OC_03005 [Solirubrobacterales bacterium]